MTKFEKKMREAHAAGTLGFMQRKEVAKHAGGFEGWLANELARLEAQSMARNAWAERTAHELI